MVLKGSKIFNLLDMALLWQSQYLCVVGLGWFGMCCCGVFVVFFVVFLYFILKKPQNPVFLEPVCQNPFCVPLASLIF